MYKERRQITFRNLIVLTVIILIIITSISYTLKSSKKNYELKQYVSKLELIQEKVNLIRAEYKVWNKYNPNESGNYYSYLQEHGFTNANSSSNVYKEDFEKIVKGLSGKGLDNWNENVDSILTNYFYFSPDDLNQKLQLENINYYVIINFYTGNIIEKDGIYDKGKREIVHRQYDTEFGNNISLNPIYNDNTEAKIEVVENRGLNQKVRISINSIDGAVVPDILDVFYYTEAEDTLKSCSYLNDYRYDSSEKAVYFTVSRSNKYSFVIKDSNFIQYKKVEKDFNLCNPPILKDDMVGIYWNENKEEVEIKNIYDANWYDYSFEKMKFANAKTEDGNYWVWIPRYSFKENKEDIDIEFVSNLSSLSTSNKSLTGYNIQKAFSENGEITGFWVSKFQANVDNGKVNIKPGKTLTFNKMDENIRKQIMTNNQRKAVLAFATLKEFEISNDLVHYAGGSPEAKGFIENTRYSNTNNEYGVYDLICPENELTAESSINEEGRFRLVIK